MALPPPPGGGGPSRRDALAAASAAAFALATQQQQAQAADPSLLLAMDPTRAAMLAAVERRRAAAAARGPPPPSPLPVDAYYTLNNGMRICRLTTGLLQLSPKTSLRAGSTDKEDYWRPPLTRALDDMKLLVDSGFTSFDVAQVYGPAEDYCGAYIDRYGKEGVTFMTKWIPQGSGPKPREVVLEGLDSSRTRMHMSTLDIVQFYW
eukprot:CAMPEP_0206238432 /NCGR_PEP_ID=MMETSP0047_2-20121206/14815_1 /ASSEMBLY_ACC=CAM_ASM_000192 /TAXON_ID=195065 /ORGANISM="Chroomonas mesostigmatica_cf, Strain CCMP1168" /LENGTH=205 /DNA_ID=CAMNT_0053662973 /DNA_START=90 /DNA_END=704 /DNA_ORIENTATION=-